MIQYRQIEEGQNSEDPGEARQKEVLECNKTTKFSIFKGIRAINFTMIQYRQIEEGQNSEIQGETSQKAGLICKKQQKS